MRRGDFQLQPLEGLPVRGRYTAVGAGPAVVLLASPLVRVRPYRPTVEHLARGHRVYAVELPGSGRADPLPEPWSVTDYARWTAAAVEALGLTDVTVIGHSHTGGVVVELAAFRPTRVGRVVIADAIGAYQQSLGCALVGRAADTLTREARLAAREWASLAYTLATHPRNFWHQVRVSLGADLTGTARRVVVPALVAWGARDHTTPPASARTYARCLPRAEVYVSAGGSHDWPITDPAEFAAAVAGFIRRTGGPAGPRP
jgi:pimeloyl-ACP methyl ester carboxylesterase